MAGVGLQKIQDDNVAQALLRKTNAMNLDIGKKAVGAVLVLAALPEFVNAVLQR